jgi:ectoine hydroxylase-related dioxygenase (phytanoyl-CoA dioxygenase family)
VRDAFDTRGYVVVSSLFSKDEVAAGLSAVEEATRAARADPTKRVAAGAPIVSLLNAGPAIDPFWTHPVVLATALHVLGPDFRLQWVRSRTALPGHGGQRLHSEAPARPEGDLFDLNLIVPLVDFTAANGATRVVPGSHRKAPYFDRAADHHPEEIQVECAAGSLLAFSAHLTHSGMPNTSTQPRPSIQVFFARRGLGGPMLDEGHELATNETIDRIGDLALLLI